MKSADDLLGNLVAANGWAVIQTYNIFQKEKMFLVELANRWQSNTTDKKEERFPHPLYCSAIRWSFLHQMTSCGFAALCSPCPRGESSNIKTLAGSTIREHLKPQVASIRSEMEKVRKQFDKLVAGLLLCALALPVVFLLGCRKGEPKEKSNVPPVVKTKTGIEMVLIPGGWSEMGSNEEDELDESRHRVYVSSFYVDRYEITQEEYEKVMRKNPSRWKRGKNPVEQVRWAKAVEYCNARSRLEGLQPAYNLKTWECDFEANGYRLPTEAEWEYAARGGAKTRYSFGDSPSKLRLYAWFKDNCSRSPRPVGQKRPNPWGLYDIYGNVWEWCNDFYKEGYYQESPEKNPRGPKAGKTRVLRGGCWNSSPDKCRSSYRENEDPGYTDVCFGRDVHGFCGFRCVRSYGAP